jgi:DNA mismatch repair protein MLH1
LLPSSGDDDEDASADIAETKEESSHNAWQLEHVLFPSFRRHTAWPKDLLGREMNQVANLPDLFRIFERC